MTISKDCCVVAGGVRKRAPARNVSASGQQRLKKRVKLVMPDSKSF